MTEFVDPLQGADSFQRHVSIRVHKVQLYKILILGLFTSQRRLHQVSTIIGRTAQDKPQSHRVTGGRPAAYIAPRGPHSLSSGVVGWRGVDVDH